VARQRLLAVGKDIVHGQAGLDDERAALGGPVEQAQELERGVEHAGEPLEDGDGGGQRLDVVGGVVQQAVALGERFLHQAELAVFEVAQAAVRHVRRGRAGPSAEIAPVHQQRVHAVEGQLAEDADAVDARADDEDRDIRLLPGGFEKRLSCHG